MKTRLVALPLAAASLSLFTAGVAFADPGGYGPSSPTGPAGTPGGFTAVVTTQSVSAAGGEVTGAVSGGDLKVAVPAGAFPASAQVVVTKPDLAAVTSATLSSAGFSGFKAAAGLGFKALDASGNPITGKFASPVTLTLSGPGLGVAGEKVLVLSGTSAASVLPSKVGAGSVTFTLDEDPNIVVVNPDGAAASGAVAGATAKSTGKPFAGESAAALAALAAGAGAVVFSRRRRTAQV